MATKEQSHDYSEGYNAGRKRSDADEARAARERQEYFDSIKSERRKFLDAVFLAVIPEMVNAQGWTTGGVEVKTAEQRVGVAWSIAKSAFDKRPS